MGTAAAMLAEARRSLGVRGRPNYITQDYAKRHGSAFLRAAWCDMAVTYWARHSGNAAAVLPGGDRAYTVWHAQDFQKIGRWYPGTTANVNRAKPGDIVFFDWGGTNGIGAIDHVGIVEKALGGGRVQTIEANTGDACLRRVRSASVIAGYGRPAYSGSPSGGSVVKEDPLIGLKKGDRGQAVKALQEMIRYAGQGAYLDAHGGTDGDYGNGTAEALRRVRASVGSNAGPGYGDKVDGWAYAQLHAAVARNQGKQALKKV
ncbi:CHAP domain-containing protein [Actinomadura sp. SCN-SB]|uniref:CHAP domain-containing protein n=1 Tax=Actinomadura sp. SCN-SB TaxID=3373092 RepID=UPI0037539FA5